MPNRPPTRGDIDDLSRDVQGLTNALKERDKHLLLALAGLVLAIVAALGFAWVARDASSEANARSKQTAVLTARLDAVVERQEMDRCLNTNTSRRATRTGDESVANALILATTPEPGADPERIARHQQAVEEFKAGLQEGFAGLEPVDCDGDGEITDADFAE